MFSCKIKYIRISACPLTQEQNLHYCGKVLVSFTLLAERDSNNQKQRERVFIFLFFRPEIGPAVLIPSKLFWDGIRKPYINFRI